MTAQPDSGRHGAPAANGRTDIHSLIEFHAGPPGGDATRHLSAAAYLDRNFRTKVIAELVENRYRVPAPTPGIEADRVLDHCLRARRAAVVTGSATIAIGLLGLMISPFAVLIVLVMAVLLRGTRAAASTIAGPLRRWSGSAPTGRSRSLSGIVMVGFLIVLLASTATVGQFLPWAGGASIVADFGVMAMWILTGAVSRYWIHSAIVGLHNPDTTVPGASFPAFRGVFDKLRMREVEVDTIYGSFSPFAGSGLEITGADWNLSIELRPNEERRKKNVAAEPMESPDIHRHITAALSDLRAGPLYPGDLLHRIIVSDRVFRSGLRLDPPSRWLGYLAKWDDAVGRPVLDPGWADMLDLAAHERLRHYTEARVELWESQIVASVFVRAQVQGNLLELEGLATLLPPVAEQYRLVDEAQPLDPVADGAAALFEAVCELPADILHAATEPLAWIRSSARSWTRGRWYRGMIGARRAVDHAPRLSVRELGAQPVYQQRFQEADVNRFYHSVARRSCTAALETLRNHGYDTSEVDRILQNINNGTQNFGTINNSGQLAIGDGANANHVVKTPPPKLSTQQPH